MKKLLLIIAIFLAIFSANSFAQFSRETSFDERPHCEEAGGVWRQFGSGCADQCRPKFDKFAICTRAVTSGCDCGKGKCWNENNCVSLKEYSAIFEQEQAEEKLILDKAKKTRIADAKENQEEILKRLSKESKPTDKPNAKPANNNSIAGDITKQLTMPSMPTTSIPSISDLSKTVEIPPFFKQQQQAQAQNQEQAVKNPANNKTANSGLVGALIGNNVNNDSKAPESIMPAGLPEIALPN